MKSKEELAKEYSDNYPPFYQSKIAYDAYIKGATEWEAITKREMVEKAMVVFQSMSIKIINTTEGGEQWRTLKENYRKALEAEI